MNYRRSAIAVPGLGDTAPKKRSGTIWGAPAELTAKSGPVTRRQPMSSIGHTAYNHIGADPVAPVAAVSLAAYHGYRRNRSVGWAIGWGVLASLSWPITLGVAVAEGFGKPRRS
jgi:hypothetical protein